MLESLNDYLRDVYKETRYTHHTEWPPDQPKSVVSNTLIHYKDKKIEQAMLDMSKHHRGASSVDEITSSHPSMVTKSITSIFELPDQKFILIEGAPGIGKTVLVKEIVYRWACGEVLQGKKLFLLFVRDPNLHSVDSINQRLISYFSCDYLGDSEVDVAVDELKKSRRQNIVFVIDGLDECPTDGTLNQFIEKLAKHEIFPKSTVVITSRHHASILLRDFADQRIEILGFAKGEREKYISELLKEFPDKEAELKKYLKVQPIINSVMHVPLLYLFKQNSMPETLTELNEQFVIHTIFRHLEKQEHHSPLPLSKKVERITDLPEHILKIVKQLSQLAMSGFDSVDWPPRCLQKLVFTYEDVKAACPEIDSIPNGFGLLQAVQHYVVRGAGSATSFSFLHLTVQEFLAAYYISTLPSDEQLHVTFQEGISEYVWLMYVGIVGIKSESFIKFQSTPTEGFLNNDNPFFLGTEFNSHSKLLFLFQCYLEARQFAQVPENLSPTFKDGNVVIRNEELQSYNMVSLIHFIVKSDVQFTSLCLSDCKITGEGVHILTEFLTDHLEKISSIKYISLQHNNITSLWGTHHHSVCDGSTDSPASRSFVIPYFDLSFNMLRDEGIMELSTALHYDKTLVELDVSHNDISDIGAVAISNCLKSNCTLQVLSVSHNKISDDGIKAFSDLLKTNNSLKELDIAGNSITNMGAKEIAGALKSNKTLAYLNISGNNVLDDGICAICDSIKQHSTLAKLDVAGGTITNKGAMEIAEVLKSNTTLNYLNISRNWIDKEGIMSILTASKEFKTLHTLECIFNTLSQSDFIDIIDFVRKENAVEILNAS